MQDASKNLSPGQLAWNRFKKNRLAVFGLGVIVFAALVAILGGLIRPDSTQHANDQQLALSKKGINFKVNGIVIRKNVDTEASSWWEQLFFGGEEMLDHFIPIQKHWYTGDSIYIEKYTGDESHGQELRFHLLDVVYPIAGSLHQDSPGKYSAQLTNGDSVHVVRDAVLQQIEANNLIQRRYLFGTDKFGRDMFSRLMAGTIVSLSVGLISVFISLLLGLALGAMAGYFGGWLDDLITWLINVIWSIPTLLLVIAITFALGKGFVQVFVAVGLTMWVEVARVVRGQVMSVRNQEYIEAARSMGYGPSRIIVKHILPNIMGPVIVVSAANFASAILLEAGLSFLGIGAQIPMASWGQMIKEHYSYITTDMAYLAVLPGLCILILVLSFMLIGNGLRDSIDTRSV